MNLSYEKFLKNQTNLRKNLNSREKFNFENRYDL